MASSCVLGDTVGGFIFQSDQSTPSPFSFRAAGLGKVVSVILGRQLSFCGVGRADHEFS